MLAREVAEVRVAVEEAGGVLDDAGAVEELVRGETLERAARDVAHGVAATAGGRDAGRVEVREHLG